MMLGDYVELEMPTIGSAFMQGIVLHSTDIVVNNFGFNDEDRTANYVFLIHELLHASVGSIIGGRIRRSPSRPGRKSWITGLSGRRIHFR
jgi:hypothetical protein